MYKSLNVKVKWNNGISENVEVKQGIRDRPFNLKGWGGLWFFVSFRIFFSDNLEYLFFLSRKARIFFPEFNIRLYEKNSESD